MLSRTLPRRPYRPNRPARLRGEEGPQRARPADLGAGALTDRADRLVRALTSGRGPDVMGNRPGSVLVIVILIVGSVVFGLLALESTDNPTPRAIAPAEVASADDIGRRVYATIEGVVADNFVETFPDDDGEASRTRTRPVTPGTTSSSTSRAVASPSAPPGNPVDIYRYTATGVVVRDPEYVSVDVAEFGKLDGTSGIELDDTFYLDASTAPPGSPQPLDLSAEMPAPGTAVTIAGPLHRVARRVLRRRGRRRRSARSPSSTRSMRSSPTRAAAGRSPSSRPTSPSRSRSSSPGCCATRPPRSARRNRRATSTSIRSGSRSRTATSSMIRRRPRAPDCRSVSRSSPDCWPRSWRSDSSADIWCSDGRSDRFHRAAGPWDRATRSRSM